MSLMEWGEGFSVGIESIDNQHKKLIDLINQLHAAMLSGAVNEAIKPILDGLIDYTKTHFAYEENLFAENGYADSEAHKAIHDSLTAKVVELQEKVNAGENVLGMEVMNFLKDWLINHIQGADKKYAPFLIEKGVQ